MRAKLLITFIFLLFAGPLAAQDLTGTLKQIDASGQIRIGYRDSHPPMSFVAPNGKPDGYSIDICKAIAAGIESKLGKSLKIKYVHVTATDRFEAVEKNRIDILCGSTTKTLSRGERVDFTQLTFVTGASLMTLAENDKFETAGFDGSKIGVLKSTTTEVVLKDLIRDTGTDAEIILYNSTKDGVDALRQKKIDAFSADQVVLIGIASDEKDRGTFEIKPQVFSFEPFALAVRRNDSDFRLAADRVISELYRTKKIYDIYDRWVGKYTRQRLPIFDAMVQLNATPE